MAAAAMLAFASCSDTSGKLEESFGCPMLNLIVDNSTDGDAPVIKPLTYAYHINYTDAVMDITVPPCALGENSISFAIENATYKFGNLSFNVDRGSVPVTGQTQPVTNFNSRLTSAINMPPSGVMGDLAYSVRYDAVISFVWGNYTVRSFPSEAVYAGTTRTTAPGSDDYTTKTPTYRFTINPNDMTARLIIYNAKFSDNPKMPALNLRLDGLKVTPGTNGYTITGTDVVPQTLAEGTPYPSFTFATINFATLSTDLTSGKLEFNINSPFGELTASFTGSYLFDSTQAQ